MKAYRFNYKWQTQTYSTYTLIAVVLSIFIFSGLDMYISKEMAYLLVTILSSISLYAAIKKASKELEEIIISGDEIKFYFQNKAKSPLALTKTNVSIEFSSESIEFRNLFDNKTIGIVNKNKLSKDQDWNEFKTSLKNL